MKPVWINGCRSKITYKAGREISSVHVCLSRPRVGCERQEKLKVLVGVLSPVFPLATADEGGTGDCCLQSARSCGKS